MIKVSTSLLVLAILVSTVARAQDVLTMDEEPHYSRVFSNEYCRAYMVSLGRLEETKPVIHERDWVRMTLGGTAEQAWNGTVFGSASYEDPDGYLVSFLPPVARVALRNPRIDPYRALIVEILKNDDSENRWRDTSLDPFARTLGPGVDTHASYTTRLTKASVEMLNVQLLPRDSKDIHTHAVGTLVIAMTGINLSRNSQGGVAENVQLAKGDVQWLAGADGALENLGDTPARLVLLALQ